jgi:hypothetical protein
MDLGQQLGGNALVGRGQLAATHGRRMNLPRLTR